MRLISHRLQSRLTTTADRTQIHHSPLAFHTPHLHSRLTDLSTLACNPTPSNNHNNFPRLPASRLQDLADTVEVEEAQAILAFRTEAKALEEVGDSSQEEAHQEGQEEDPTATAEVDQATPRALELDHTSASNPHHSGIMLWEPS